MYLRYSDPNNQRETSIEDQRRKCNEALERMGIDPANVTVLKDKGIRGDREDRETYQTLLEMIERGEVAILIVDQQSRFSRGENVKSMIKDLVFSGGRFIAVGDGIDTDNRGWEDLVSIKEFTNSAEIRTTGWRVRRGLEGRVQDAHGSAGDYPIGYESAWVNPEAAAAYTGKGPKPKRKVVIFEPAAEVIRRIFKMFLTGMSINQIVRHLIDDDVPKYSKGRRRGWYASFVREILRNPKYIGQWTYGATTTKRNSKGKKKSVPLGPDQRVIVADRPELRIIDQETWDKAQQLLAELKAEYGMKPGQKQRGFRAHYTKLYPKSFLSGIRCEHCGGPMGIYHADETMMLKCRNIQRGICRIHTGVPLKRAEDAVIELLRDVLLNHAEWMSGTAEAMRQAIASTARQAPEQLGTRNKELADVDSQINNLVDVLARGLDSQATRAKLTMLEQRQGELRGQIAELEKAGVTSMDPPTDEWFREQLRQLAEIIRESAVSLRLVQGLFQDISACEVKPLPRKRGYIQLHVKLDPNLVLGRVLANKLSPPLVQSVLSQMPEPKLLEYTLDLAFVSKADRMGPQIAALRDQGLNWEHIAQQLGLTDGGAYMAWKRWRAKQAA